MELTQHSLFEELIMAPKIDSSFPTDFFQNAWNFAPFDQTPDFLFPATNPALLELISPPDQFANPCPFGEFQPFLDALTSPEFGSFYEKDDLPPMSVPEDYAAAPAIGKPFLDGGFKVESAQNDDAYGQYGNVGMYSEKKSKSKKPEGQPSKNLMAERRRRKRLNDRLSMLRSIVPKISKMDRTSILGDTIDYMRELLDKIHKLREEEGGVDESEAAIRGFLKELKPHEMQLRNPPKFDVERRNKDTRIELCCTAKPGLLLSTLTTLDALGLDLQQCVISCFNDFSLQASCFEATEQRSTLSSEDVKQALFRNAGYGGRCL